MLLSSFCYSQIEISIGQFIIQDTRTDNAITWEAGYTQRITESFHVNGKVRYTGYLGDIFYTPHVLLKHRSYFNEGIFFDVGGGVGYHSEDFKEFFPSVSFKAYFEIDPGIYTTLAVDDDFRSYNTVYFMVGIAISTRKGLSKNKPRFF